MPTFNITNTGIMSGKAGGPVPVQGQNEAYLIKPPEITFADAPDEYEEEFAVFYVTILFDTDVEDFIESDVTVISATVDDFIKISNREWRIYLEPDDAPNDVEISVGAAVCTEIRGGQANLASATLYIPEGI